MTGCRFARRHGAAGGVAGAIALALWLLCCFANRVQAQTAYFSATGTFSNNSQTQDFFFGVGNVSNSLVLRTYAYGGGGMASGLSVGSGGIDSTLNLFTGGGASIAFNDDNPAANPGANGNHYDSLLTYNGSGTTLVAPQPAGAYRLRLANSSGPFGDGHWATDLINTSGSISLTGSTPSVSSIMDSVAMGGSDVLHQAVFSLSAGSININTELRLNNNGVASISGGTLSIGYQLESAGTVTQTGGTVLATRIDLTGNSSYAISGGTLNPWAIIYLGANTPGTFTQTGGLVSTDSVVVGLNCSQPCTYTLNAGTLNATVGVGAGLSSTNDSFLQNGGAIAGGYLYVGGGNAVQGTFTMNGGSCVFGNGFVGGNSGAGTLTVGSGAAATFTSVLQLAAPGTISIAGGTVNAGTIDTTGGGSLIWSTGTINITAAGLNVSTTGLLGPNILLGGNKGLSVSGLTTIAPGAALQLTNTTFPTGSLLVSSGGNFAFNSGTLQITGSTGLTIGSGAGLGATVNIGTGQFLDVTGAGSTNVAASGMLYLGGGNVRSAGTISNAGIVQLASPLSTLTGQGSFNNTSGGLILGTGRVSAVTFTNQSGGEVRVAASDALRFTGNFNNAGTINVLGGSLDILGPWSNTGATNLAGGALHLGNSANNTGRISGRGVINADVGLTNLGTMSLSGGFSDVHGGVGNNSGAKITVTGGGVATFYDDVTNVSGSGFQVSTASTAVFLGNVTGLAAFTGSGVKDFEAGASAGPLATLSGSTIVEATGALTATTIREHALTVAGVASVALNGGTLATSRVDEFTIAGSTNAWTGKLDLNDNAVVIDYATASPIATVKNQIKSGCANGSWTGNGISSSAAALAATSAHKTGVGYAEAAELNAGSFAGQTVDSTSLLIRYTLLGDADLNRTVDLTDFTFLAAHFNQSGQTWLHGDFDYNGTVDLTDFTFLASNFNQVLAAGGESAGSIGAPVPEPCGTALLIASMTLALQHGARRNRCMRTNSFDGSRRPRMMAGVRRRSRAWHGCRARG